MTGILNTLVGFVSTGSSIPTVIGQAYEGGFYAGQISTNQNGIATHYLVIAPASSGETLNKWKTSNTDSPGTNSVIDGPANTAAMNDASHPCANFCATRTIGGYTDWYMPAKLELEVCYYNLKPTTDANNSFKNAGINPYAVPPRASVYGALPVQTTAVDFQVGNSQPFTTGFVPYYWPSTQFASTFAYVQNFRSGRTVPYLYSKISMIRARAMRRVAV